MICGNSYISVNHLCKKLYIWYLFGIYSTHLCKQANNDRILYGRYFVACLIPSIECGLVLPSVEDDVDSFFTSRPSFWSSTSIACDDSPSLTSSSTSLPACAVTWPEVLGLSSAATAVADAGVLIFWTFCFFRYFARRFLNHTCAKEDLFMFVLILV